MRTYHNLMNGIEIPNTERSAESVNEIINEAIDDFPVDDLMKEAIAEKGENDEQGFTACIGDDVYEVTIREGFQE